MKKLFIVAAIALLGGVMTACSSSDEPDNSLVVWDATPVQFYWDMSEYFSVFNESSEMVKKALEMIGRP